jgi:hypothetical protein
VFLYDEVNNTNSWTTLSTMGAADTIGENNFYVEDDDFHAWLNAFDQGDNGRMVVRYSALHDSAFGTHGADTGPYGQRHFEVYNNTFLRHIYSDGSSFPLPRWFYIRGGTYAVHDNVFTVSPDGNDYPDPVLDMTHMSLQRNAGPNPCWGADIPGIQYNAPRQVGFGRVTGAAGNDPTGVYVGDSEPAYIWNNTGAVLGIGISDFGGVECTNPDSSVDYIILDRDYFVGTAKPSYTAFTYPHPLRSGESGSPQAGSPVVIMRVMRWMELLMPVVGLGFHLRRQIVYVCVAILSCTINVSTLTWQTSKWITKQAAVVALTALNERMK